MSARDYKISMAIFGALGVLGLAVQYMLGGFAVRLLMWPVNLIAAALIVLAAAILTLYREKAAFRLLSGIPFSVTAIGALLVCCLVMGLVPQYGRGFLTAVTSSWPFALIYLALLLSLGCVIARSFFCRKGWGFYLNHIGLWLVLVGAGPGHADYRELTVKIPEGQTAIHGINDRMVPEALPYSVRLDDFRMEEYPAKWGVVDMRTGKFQPEKKPVYYDTEQEAFARNPLPGVHERVASTMPEPKSFASDITVTFPDGKSETAATEVNRPYRKGSWALYQTGYDREAGPESAYSVLKAIRDPWLPVVYLGIAMLAIGAVSMLTTKKRKNDGVE